MQWIRPDLAMCASGEGKLQLIAMNREAKEMKLHTVLSSIHTATIREIAINQAYRTQFISGGHDRQLCVVDLERLDVRHCLQQEGIIGSVRWPLCNQNVCPSCTLDDGIFKIYDARTPTLGAAAFALKTGKKVPTHTVAGKRNVCVAGTVCA